MQRHLKLFTTHVERKHESELKRFICKDLTNIVSVESGENQNENTSTELALTISLLRTVTFQQVGQNNPKLKHKDQENSSQVLYWLDSICRNLWLSYFENLGPPFSDISFGIEKKAQQQSAINKVRLQKKDSQCIMKYEKLIAWWTGPFQECHRRRGLEIFKFRPVRLRFYNIN